MPSAQQAQDLAFLESHKHAIEREEAIGGELGHKGKRQSLFEILMGPEGNQFFRGIADMENSFAIWDRAFDKKGAPLRTRVG
jgi:hypothetical protein